MRARPCRHADGRGRPRRRPDGPRVLRLSGTTPAVDRYLLQRQFRRMAITGDGSINPSRCTGSVPHIHRRRGTVVAASVEAHRLMVGIVVEPDARAEQDLVRCAGRSRRSGRARGVDIRCWARKPRRSCPGRLQRDAHRLVHRTTENGDALGLTRVLPVVGENKDGPSHAPPYGRESPIALSKSADRHPRGEDPRRPSPARSQARHPWSRAPQPSRARS